MDGSVTEFGSLSRSTAGFLHVFWLGHSHCPKDLLNHHIRFTDYCLRRNAERKNVA
ncbi:N-lysine methyltransferase KMT5A [Clarias magur]|uniref:N-lysine methyltransferase KMT5A n=1 Tax=Clarias magur TaxID=1594786 RepID=A0A8J4U444_CLAMG|nr:N-lysine methyltransferase KMT5A [Clarias magur]